MCRPMKTGATNLFICRHRNLSDAGLSLDQWCLTPLSTIFQAVTDKLYHIMLYGLDAGEETQVNNDK
jgi:hypothetical protein